MDGQKQELMIKQIKLFDETIDVLLEVKDGRPYYKGLLSCVSDGLPDNLVVDGSLMCYIHSTKLPKGLKVTELLDVSETDITEIPDDCEFKSLNVSHTKITKLRDNLCLDELGICETGLTTLPKGLKVKGELNISYSDITDIPDDCEFGCLAMEETKITKLRNNLNLIYLDARGSALQQLPKGLKVKGQLNVSETNITEIPNDCEFGSLFMNDTKIKKLRDNLVLNNLSICNSSLTELSKNLIIYYSLDNENTNIKSLPYDCLVDRVHCRSMQNDERYKKDTFDYYYHLKDEIVHLKHSSGKEFLHVDDILSEVIEKKGNVYRVRNGVNEPITYVVTDGNNHWAHGDTLEKAKQDLHYKMSIRDKSEYKDLTLDSELMFDEAVACYRVITGACRMGTQDYLEHCLPNPRKEKYSIKEIIELTQNEYGGNTFREFFKKIIK